QNIEILQIQIKDFNDISVEYQNHVARTYAAGIITGYTDRTFKFERTATRAEATTMLLRLLEPSKRQIPEVKEIIEVPAGVTHINDLKNEDITKYIKSGTINHPFYYEVVDPDLPSVKKQAE
ncbi:S-layer homology domain-containing protein, partial [Stenotrophomonas maltophilia group sp. RNC7]|uniref:S-layer homology domain-containing protein n=1 Tax=Stenotrophomonas maltophilia group sp. RNC7 TaxID=3071467 RepID=UPI0027DEBA3D